MAVCSKCGSELVEGTKVCAKCGQAVLAEATAPLAAQVAGFGGPAAAAVKRRRSYAAPIAVIIVVLLAAAAAAYYFLFRMPAMMDMAKLAPKDSVVYFVLDLTPTPEHTRAIQPIIDRVKAKGLDQKLEQWLSTVQGTGPAISFKQDIEPWFGGQAAVAISSIAPMPSVSLLVSARDPAKAAAFLDKVKARMGAMASWKSETYQGVTIWSQPGMVQMAMAATGPAVVLTTSVDGVKKVVDRVQGREQGLADDAAYQEVKKRAPASAVGLAFISPSGYADMMQQIMQMMTMFMPRPSSGMPPMPEGPGPAPPMQLMPGPMGTPEMPNQQQMEQGMKALTEMMSRVKSMGGWLVVEPSGLRAESVNVYLPGKAIKYPTASGATLKMVPESAIAVCNLGSLKEWWDYVLSVNPFFTSDPEIVNGIKQLQQLTGLNLQSDILGWMTKECTVAFLGMRSDQKTPMAMGVFQTDKPEVLKGMIQKVTAFVTAKLGKPLTESNGVTTLPLPIPELSLQPSFAVVNDALVLGTHPELVKGKPAERSILDKPSFKEAVGQLPAKNQALFFVDLTEVWKTVESAIGADADTKEWGQAQPFLAAFKSMAMYGGQADDVDSSSAVLKLDFNGLIDAIAEAAK